MAWVAIDDDFVAHPKIVQLTDPEFRTWMRILCYSARFRTRGWIEKRVARELPGVTQKRMTKFVEIRLLEQRENGWYIHDWDAYNGTGKEREQARLRKQAERERAREDRDMNRDNVTAPSVTKSQKSHGALAGAPDAHTSRRRSRPQDPKGPQPEPTPILQTAVPLPDPELQLRSRTNERAPDEQDELPARNGHGLEPVEDDIDFNVDIPTTIDPLAALRNIGGAA